MENGKRPFPRSIRAILGTVFFLHQNKTNLKSSDLNDVFTELAAGCSKSRTTGRGKANFQDVPQEGPRPRMGIKNKIRKMHVKKQGRRCR